MAIRGRRAKTFATSESVESLAQALTGIHFARAEAVREQGQRVLDAAFSHHPDGFRRPSSAPRLPEEAWINRPEEVTLAI